MTQTPLINDFSRGEISPDMLGRIGTDMFARGAKEVRNFIVTKTGAISRRNGTRFLANIKSSTDELNAFKLSVTEAAGGTPSLGPLREVHVFHVDPADSNISGGRFGVRSFRLQRPQEAPAHRRSGPQVVAQSASTTAIRTGSDTGGHLGEAPLVNVTPLGRATLLSWPEAGFSLRTRSDDIYGYIFKNSGTRTFHFLKKQDFYHGFKFPRANWVSGASKTGLYELENNFVLAATDGGSSEVITLSKITAAMRVGMLVQDDTKASDLYKVWERTGVINRTSTSALSASCTNPPAGDDANWALLSSGVFTTQYATPEIAGKASAIAVHQNRLFIAQNTSNGMRVIGSWVNAFGLFAPTVSGAADQLVDIFIPGEPGEVIVWMASVGGDLVIGTNRGEYVASGLLTPSTVALRRYTSFGSEAPIFAPFYGTVLFVQSGGQAIRDFVFSNEAQSYVSRDISAQAAHLFMPGVVSLAIVTRPINAVAAATRDGQELMIFTYERSTDVEAWSRHSIGEKVYAAEVLEIGGETLLVTVVKRGNYYTLETINFNTPAAREDMVYLDMAVRFKAAANDTPKTSVDLPTGYREIAQTTYGDKVRVVRNGIDLGDVSIVNDGGVFKVPVTFNANDTVYVGFPFESELETTPIVTRTQTGIGQFNPVQLVSLNMRVFKSGDFEVAGTDTMWSQVHLRPATGEGLFAHPLYTGDVDISLESDVQEFSTIRVRTNNTMPLNFSAIMPTVEVNG